MAEQPFPSIQYLALETVLPGMADDEHIIQVSDTEGLKTSKNASKEETSLSFL